MYLQVDCGGRVHFFSRGDLYFAGNALKGCRGIYVPNSLLEEFGSGPKLTLVALVILQQP